MLRSDERGLQVRGQCSTGGVNSPVNVILRTNIILYTACHKVSLWLQHTLPLVLRKVRIADRCATLQASGGGAAARCHRSGTCAAILCVSKRASLEQRDAAWPVQLRARRDAADARAIAVASAFAAEVQRIDLK